MSKVTINALTVPGEYHGSYVEPIVARLEAYQDFTSSEGDPIPKGSGWSGFGQEFGVAIDGNGIITIAPGDAYATTNSPDKPNGKYKRLAIYDATGKLITSLYKAKGIKIPHMASPTTWEACRLYTEGAASNPVTDPVLALVEEEIAALGASLATTLPATRTLTSLHVDYSDNLSSLISALGSAKTTVDMSHDVTVSSAISVPANIVFSPRDGAKFIKSGSGTLTFQGEGITGDPHFQIFSGFASGEVSFTGRYPARFRPEWWGAVPDGWFTGSYTDNAGPFQLTFDAMNMIPLHYSGGPVQGGIVQFDDGYYRIDSEVQISRPCVVQGTGRESSRIMVGPNTNGFRINGWLTQDGGLPSRFLQAIDTYFRDFGITGCAAESTHTVSCVGRTITRVTGDDWGLVNNIAIGNTLQLNTGVHWGIKAVTDGDTIELLPYRMSVVAVNSTTIWAAYINFPASYVGATVKINGTDYTILSITASSGGQNLELDSAHGVDSHGAQATIDALPDLGTISINFNAYSGIDARIRWYADNMSITGMYGNGITMNSGQLPSTDTSSQPNTNYSGLSRMLLQGNKGAGLYTHGVNANTSEFSCISFEGNTFGIWENSFLGNTYLNIHCQGNIQGIIIQPSVRPCGSTIINGYTEGDQASVFLGASSSWNGGTDGCGFAVDWPNSGLICGGTFRHLNGVSDNLSERFTCLDDDDNIAMEVTLNGGQRYQGEHWGLKFKTGTDDGNAFFLTNSDALHPDAISLAPGDQNGGSDYYRCLMYFTQQGYSRGAGLIGFGAEQLHGHPLIGGQRSWLCADRTSCNTVLANRTDGDQAFPFVSALDEAPGLTRIGGNLVPWGANGLESVAGTAGKIPTWVAGGAGGLKLGDAVETGTGAVVRTAGPALNGGAALGSTSTEIDRFNDVSAYVETVIAAGALSVSKVYSNLALVGAGAVTLAAPDGSMLGKTKTIEMTVDNGDVTLALTNVVGQSSGTTATFNDVGDTLVLLAANSKWVVLKELGITLS